MEQELEFAEEGEFLSDSTKVYEELDFIDDFVNGNSGGEVTKSDLSPVFLEDDNEDTRLIAEMTGKLLDAGYVAVDGVDYGDMQKLLTRVKENLEEECELLRSIAIEQKNMLQDVLEDISVSQATLLPNVGADSFMERISTLSADSILGVELSQKASRWVNDYLRQEQSCTTKEVYDSFIDSHIVQPSLYLFKESALFGYMDTLIPVVREGIKRRVSRIREAYTQRELLAECMNKTESSNTKSLETASAYAIIRQLFYRGDGVYETVCPVCGYRFAVKKPVFRILAYLTEHGVQKRYFIGHIGCQCGCALMFTLSEYKKMFQTYTKECRKSVEAYLSEAKNTCQGAVELQISVSVESVIKEVEYLVVDEHSPKNLVNEGNAAEYIMVDDHLYHKAVNQFYFKLKGLGPLHSSGIEDNFDLTDNNLKRRAPALVEEKRKSELGISYHDLAVYVTQCLSKDYKIEKNRAIFSLIQYLKNNQVLSDLLSDESIWELECQLIFLRRYKEFPNPRSLTEREIAEIQMLLMLLNDAVGYSLPKEREKLLEEAVSSISRLEQLIGERKKDKRFLLNQLHEWRYLLAHCKMIKINNCKIAELQAFLGDYEIADELDEIANMMIIHNFAQKYYCFWKNLRIIRSSKIDNMLKVKASNLEVAEELQNIMRRLLDGYQCIQPTKALQSFESVYFTDSESDAYMLALGKAVSTCDFYEFCRLMYEIPQYLQIDRKLSAALFKLYKEQYSLFQKIANQNKLEFYFTDFSSEEIRDCVEFSELDIGAYIPVRLEGESPEAYCKRYEKIASREEFHKTVCRSNRKLFYEVKTNLVFLSLCSVIQQAEYSARSITMFVTALFDVAHNYLHSDNACNLLGISNMHYNIIRSMKNEKLIMPDGSITYRVLHGIYLTSIAEVIASYFNEWSLLNADVKNSVKTITDQYNIRDVIKHLSEMEFYTVDNDGMPENDQEEAETELLNYIGVGRDDFARWLEGIL